MRYCPCLLTVQPCTEHLPHLLPSAAGCVSSERQASLPGKVLPRPLCDASVHLSEAPWNPTSRPSRLCLTLHPTRVSTEGVEEQDGQVPQNSQDEDPGMLSSYWELSDTQHLPCTLAPLTDAVSSPPDAARESSLLTLTVFVGVQQQNQGEPRAADGRGQRLEDSAPPPEPVRGRSSPSHSVAVTADLSCSALADYSSWMCAFFSSDLPRMLPLECITGAITVVLPQPQSASVLF